MLLLMCVWGALSSSLDGEPSQIPMGSPLCTRLLFFFLVLFGPSQPVANCPSKKGQSGWTVARESVSTVKLTVCHYQDLAVPPQHQFRGPEKRLGGGKLEFLWTNKSVTPEFVLVGTNWVNVTKTYPGHISILNQNTVCFLSTISMRCVIYTAYNMWYSN